MRSRSRIAPLPIAIAALAFMLAFGGAAEAVECVGTYTDGFADGVLNSRLLGGGCGTATETGGRVVLDRPTSCAEFDGPYVTLSGDYQICGDFDVQVDYEIVGFTPPPSGSRYAGLQIYGANNEGNLILVERFLHNPIIPCMPAADVYTAWDTDPNICVCPMAPTNDVAGRFRITRTGTTYVAYYWSGGAWTQLRTGSIISGPVKVGLFTAGQAGVAHQAIFDNLSIVSSAQQIPSLTPWSISALCALTAFAGAWGLRRRGRLAVPAPVQSGGV